MTTEFIKGLEGVIVAESMNSFIDGKEGILIYKGYNIFDLAEHGTFEEIAYLFFYRQLPTQAQLRAFKAMLAKERSIPKLVRDTVKALPKGTHPMAALRTGTSMLASYDEEADDTTHDANVRKAVRLTAKLNALTGVVARAREGKGPVPADPKLSLAGNLLLGITGKRPTKRAVRIMDVALILHADHGMNASTFSSRVTCATLSDIYSAVTSGIGTLKGSLHGGANERVMASLMTIAKPEDAAQWVADRLAAKERIMGFGHRVYKTFDPRAVILKKFSEDLGKETGDNRWFDTSVNVEKAVMEQKGLYPNVDFYSASTYYGMGIPIPMYTPIFAASRVVGWSAHVIEQHDDNRLMRPRAIYVGPKDLKWVPVKERT